MKKHIQDRYKQFKKSFKGKKFRDRSMMFILAISVVVLITLLFLVTQQLRSENEELRNSIEYKIERIEEVQEEREELQEDLEATDSINQKLIERIEEKSDREQEMREELESLQSELQAKNNAVHAQIESYETAPEPPQEQVNGLDDVGDGIEGLIAQYFGSEAQYAIQVARCESGLDPLAHNFNPATGDDSYGIFQINLYGGNAHSRPSSDWLLNAENNISYAKDLRDESGWHNWANCLP